MTAARRFLRAIGDGTGLVSEMSQKGRLRLAIRRRAAILVFSPGQTGSMTVTGALQRAVPDDLVLHVHALSESGVARLLNRRALEGAPPREILAWRADVIRGALSRGPEPWRVVTIVREPVARAVSAFFAERWAAKTIDPQEEMSLGQLERLRADFLAWDGHGHGEEWLDMEFRPVVGIDLFEERFETGPAWIRVESSRFDVLVLRTESLNHKAESALAQQSLVARVDLAPKNASDGRVYGQLYRWFRENLFLPSEYLDHAYSSRLAGHFYSREEVRCFRRRWS